MSGPRGATSGLARYLPAVGWLGGYQGPWLRGDLAAGVTTAAVVIPQAIPPGLPQFAAPDLDLVGELLAPAAGVALMAFVESIAAGRAFTAKGEPEVDADQELRALGAANLAGGCFQAFPAGGGLSQTAVNRETGARTQLAGIVTALVVVLTLLFLTPLFEDLPQATLGAVVIVAVVGLVDLAALRRIRRIRFRDYALALVALAGVLVLGVLQGVLLAVIVSMLTLIHGTNHPPIEVLGRRPGSGHWRDLDRHADGETVPGLLVLRPVAPIFFANGPRLRGGCWSWSTPATHPPGCWCWTSTPSPTSTSPPWTCCRASTPTCTSGRSPCAGQPQRPAARHAAPPPRRRRLAATPVRGPGRRRGRLRRRPFILFG